MESEGFFRGSSEPTLNFQGMGYVSFSGDMFFDFLGKGSFNAPRKKKLALLSE